MTAPHRAWIPLLVLLVLGSVSSLAWLGGEALPEAGRPALALAMPAVCGATLVNLGIRWLRWHFLLRTLRLRLRARESLLVFTSLLPMILTPWAAGELLLTVALRHHTPRPLRMAGLIWLISRGADAFALLMLFLLGINGLLLPALLLVAISTLALGYLEHQGRMLRSIFRLYLFLGLSLAAWTCAAAGLSAALILLGGAVPWGEALAAYARGTLAGSLSGAPAGIAVTGAAMIQSLTHLEQPHAVALWAVAAVRWGSVGFAVLLGAGVAFLFRRDWHALVTGKRATGQGHFDELASAYAEEIPAHVRDRLVETKTAVIRRLLSTHAVPANARGLDVGCGQGWYLARLARSGFAMAGCDLTAGQVEEARATCATAGVKADLHVAPAEALPFPDNTFDFAYTINVLHHIIDPETLQRALAEITRVLKPGAPLIVFEMNTLNPVFRFYMSYLFPFIRNIDDGTEVWLTPGRLPSVAGAAWYPQVEYITFIPDFIPRPLLERMLPLEARLERSPLRRFSAHFAICLHKDPAR